MLRKYGTRINPATFGFVIEKEDFDNHGAGYESDKFFPDDVEEKDSKTESARFFSEDEDVCKTSFCCSRVQSPQKCLVRLGLYGVKWLYEN